MTTHFVDLLDALRRRSLRMASHVEDILHEACEAVFAADETFARRVVARDQAVDSEEVEVEAEVIRLLALYQPVGSDLRLLCTVLKVNSDLERVADCAVNVAERSKYLRVETVLNGDTDLQEMIPIVRNMLRNAVQAYGSQAETDAKKVFQAEEAADALYGQIIRRVVHDAVEHPSRMAAYLDLLSIAKNLERIADHATNIAEDVVFLSTGEIVRHRKLN